MSSLWLCVASVAGAHEVQPAISDITLGETRADITIELTLEAPLVGVDLDGLGDINASALAAAYDALRAEAPEVLAAQLRAEWPGIAARITLEAGGVPVPLVLEAVEVPPIGNVELPRSSTLRLSAELPGDGSAVVFGWSADLGNLIVRQQGVEAGYSGFLKGGDLSPPMDRQGGSAQGAGQAFAAYVVSGFEHIIPKGLDHILFVLGLFFLSLRMAPLLWQVSAFTLAHTLTLALATLGYVTIPAAIVEPLIAASIVYVGVENVLSKGMSRWRPLVVFGFGLLHGLGFASVLGDVGLSDGTFLVSLIGFNIGVELGQLSVIAAAFLAVGLWFGRKPWYQSRIANPASIAIALVGAWWVIERTVL